LEDEINFRSCKQQFDSALAWVKDTAPYFLVNTMPVAASNSSSAQISPLLIGINMLVNWSITGYTHKSAPSL
jgi:hypothetical protein